MSREEGKYTEVDSSLDPLPFSPEQLEMLALLKEAGSEIRDSSFFNTFSSVLPEGTKSLKEYFDTILPEGASFVEYGGPGRAVREGFSPGRIKKSAGVTLQIPPGKEIPGHTVIQGDLRDPAIEEKVSSALGGEKPHLSIERMLRGLDEIKFSPEEFIAFVEKRYAGSQIGLLVQVPYKLNDRVESWTKGLKQRFGPALEVVFYAGGSNRSKIIPHSALLIRRLEGAPVSIGPERVL